MEFLHNHLERIEQILNGYERMRYTLVPYHIARLDVSREALRESVFAVIGYLIKDKEATIKRIQSASRSTTEFLKPLYAEDSLLEQKRNRFRSLATLGKEIES